MSLVAFEWVVLPPNCSRIVPPEQKIIIIKKKGKTTPKNQNDKREGGCRIKAMKIAISTSNQRPEGIAKPARETLWKGEVPRNYGPVDPVENRQRIARERRERTGRVGGGVATSSMFK